MAFNVNQFLRSMSGGGNGQFALGDLLGRQFNQTTDPAQQAPAPGPAPVPEGPTGPVGPGIDPDGTINVAPPPPVEERVKQQEVDALLGNKNALEEAAYSMGQAPQRSGMFGTKGTLRDILGTIGDAFLVQSGNQRIYAPQREREKMGDAMTGFTQGEAEAQSAIERLAGAGFTEQAQELQKNLDAARLRQEQVASLTASRKDIANNRRISQIDEASSTIANILNSPEAIANPELANRMIENFARVRKFNPADLGFDPNMTAEERALFAQGALNPYQRQRLEYQERSLDQGDFRNETGRINANRPRPAPQPRATTNVQTWVGDDGYQYTTRSDGTTVKSTTKVQSKGNGRRQVPQSGGTRFGRPRN